MLKVNSRTYCLNHCPGAGCAGKELSGLSKFVNLPFFVILDSFSISGVSLLTPKNFGSRDNPEKALILIRLISKGELKCSGFMFIVCAVED